MKEINSMMVVIESLLDNEQIRRAVENAKRFGSWLSCQLHFVCDPSTESYVNDLVNELRSEWSNELPNFVVHPAEADRTGRILATIEKYSCDMILLQTERVLDATAEVSQIVQATSIPVLLLSSDYEFAANTPKSLLVPLSGDQRTSEALRFSLKVASQTRSSVDLLHVATSDQPSPEEASLEDLGDEVHHEFGESIDRIAAEASPYSTPFERAHIRQFHHLQGFRANAILEFVKKSPGTILVIEWKGSLSLGHAQTVRTILEIMPCPVLFTKVRPEQRSKLKIGSDLRARSNL